MTANYTYRLETVAAVKSRQQIWPVWMQEATEGLADSDTVATATSTTPFGNFTMEIARERQCPTCNEIINVGNYREDPTPLNERQCDRCFAEYVEWNDEHDPEAIEANFLVECDEVTR